MDKLTNYYEDYTKNPIGQGWSNFYDAYGYMCPYCNTWISYGNSHICYIYPYTITYSPPISNTEKAFNIMKLLVKEKIIDEPNSFKKFCDLIEKIAKVI